MTAIAKAFTDDHVRCDHSFAALEEAVASGRWEAAAPLLDAFGAQLGRHLDAEEDAVFPALEAHIGDGGPLAVMRMEHDEMRELAGRLGPALDARDPEDFLGVADTLLVLMQQHNIKEEQIVYALAEDLLGEPQRQDAVARLRP